MPGKKREKELRRRYGRMAAGMEPYYHHLDLRLLDELDDEAFAFIMAKVKGVNMLDLNETRITNQSIELMIRLEYVHEIRAKGCHGLDNGCIESLNRIRQLRLLHLKYTGITIDGLLGLKNGAELQELHFSADEDNHLDEKLRQLEIQLPGCSLIVNGKPRIPPPGAKSL